MESGSSGSSSGSGGSTAVAALRGGGVGSPRGLASPSWSAASRAAPAVRPLTARAGDMAPSPGSSSSGGGGGGAIGAPRDARAVCVLMVLRKLRQRRLAAAWSTWRAGRAGVERARHASFQALVAARSRRLCVRYGRDKLRALLAVRDATQVRLAFERWRSAAVVEHARAVLSRSTLQVQVALDQTRAERGVYERAELQAARDKRAVMLMFAFLRWRDMAALAPLTAHLAHTAAELRDVKARATRLQVAADALRDSVTTSLAAARAEGASFSTGLVEELAAAAAAPASPPRHADDAAATTAAATAAAAAAAAATAAT